VTCPGEQYCTEHPVHTVLQDIADERRRQDAKWGEQNHLDGTGPTTRILKSTDINLDLRTGSELAWIMRTRCDAAESTGQTWRNILLEEVFEALAEADPAALRGELVQVAAVATSWVEAIDRRA
jgi:hypothetical protein